MRVYSDEEMMARAQPLMGPGFNAWENLEEFSDSSDEEEESDNSRSEIDHIFTLHPNNNQFSQV